MLVASRGAYGFAPAQAAIFIASTLPVFHTGERRALGDEGALRMATAEIRQHVFTADSLAPPAVKDMFNTILEQRLFFTKKIN